MIAYKCDRCGKYFEKDEWDEDHFYITRTPKISCSFKDLCPKCNDELKEWFTNKTKSDETPWYLKIFNQDILNEYQKRMRDATLEERQSVQDYINSISTEVPYNDEGSSIHSEVYKGETKYPCEDAVSRQAVLDIINNPLNIRLDEIIEKLPPVTPQPKIGQWVYKNGIRYCEFCGASNSTAYANYCPNCGAKMVEPQESKE